MSNIILKIKKCSKTKGFQRFYHLAFTIIGTLFLTFGIAAFLTPYNIVTGGLSGIGIVVQNAFFKNSDINVVDIVAVMLNIVTFIIGFIVLGKRFAFQTFVSVIVYAISLPIFMRVLNVDELIKLESLNGVNDPRMTALFAAVCGNAFVGLGCAMTLLVGGSTGGVDVIAVVWQKYFHLKCSTGTFILDSTVIICGLIASRDVALTIVGIIGAFTNATIIDRILLGTSKSFIASIISDKYQEITDFVIRELDRSTTIIDAIGGYTKDNKKMIQVVFGRKEYTQLIDCIKKIDPQAFVSITQAHEITGEGFRSLVDEKEKK